MPAGGVGACSLEMCWYLASVSVPVVSLTSRAGCIHTASVRWQLSMGSEKLLGLEPSNSLCSVGQSHGKAGVHSPSSRNPACDGFAPQFPVGYDHNLVVNRPTMISAYFARQLPPGLVEQVQEECVRHVCGGCSSHAGVTYNLDAASPVGRCIRSRHR
jgi:hypothetical protein